VHKEHHRPELPLSDLVGSSFVAGLFDNIFVPAYDFDYKIFFISNLAVMCALLVNIRQVY